MKKQGAVQKMIKPLCRLNKVFSCAIKRGESATHGHTVRGTVLNRRAFPEDRFKSCFLAQREIFRHAWIAFLKQIIAMAAEIVHDREWLLGTNR